MKTDDLIVITGAGGFIAGALARYFKDKGFTNVKRQMLPGVKHSPLHDKAWETADALER